MMTNELRPKDAEKIWRANATKKLERTLQKISPVQGFFPGKTQPARLLDEAYELVRQVYIDLLDLEGK